MSTDNQWDAAVEAVAYVQAGRARDDIAGHLIYARASELGAVEDLLQSVAMTVVSCFEIGFGQMSKPLLDAALEASSNQREGR